MKTIFPLLVILCAPGLTYANQINLDCEVSVDETVATSEETIYTQIGNVWNSLIGDKNTFHVAINDESEVIMHYRPPNSVYKVKKFEAQGTFLPALIHYETKQSFMTDTMVIKYDINRVSLEVVQLFFIESSITGKHDYILKKQGICKVVDVKDRKI